MRERLTSGDDSGSFSGRADSLPARRPVVDSDGRTNTARDYRFPPTVVDSLKANGFIRNATPASQAVLRCATCPNTDKPFYPRRAVLCSESETINAADIAMRQYRSRALVNKRPEDKATAEAEGRAARVYYDASPLITEIVSPGHPLPGCINKNQ